MARVRIYPPGRRSGYEQLLAYYPVYYRNVFEMDALLKYFGDVCEFLEKNIEQAYLNYFVLEADGETIEHWENVFRIPYQEGRTLEERRSVVLGKLCSRDHIGEPEIRDTIAAYTPNEVWVDFDLGVIYIVIQGHVFDEMSLIQTLYEKVPAHLRIDMKIEIHRSFKYDLPIGQGGAVGTFFDFDLFDMHRESRQDLKISMGARAPKDIEGVPVDVHRELEQKEETKNMGFFQTRIKGKLIG